MTTCELTQPRMKNVIRLHAVERQTSHSRLVIQISFFFRSTVAVASSTFRDYIKLSIHQQRAKHMHASLYRRVPYYV